MSHWRETSRKIIAKVLEDTEGKDEKVIKKALREAYPFGARQWHPYKVWLDEIQVQTGKRRFGHGKEKPDPNQTNLFK